MTKTPSPHVEKPISAPTAPRQTKAALLRARLANPGGVSLSEMMRATGWQAHTLRAALTGLRKTGVILSRPESGDAQGGEAKASPMVRPGGRLLIHLAGGYRLSHLTGVSRCAGGVSRQVSSPARCCLPPIRC